MPLSFFLKAVYYSLYGLVKTAIYVFYREIRVEGLPTDEPKGPLIVLSNHPNTLMDPFLVVSQLRRPVFFLANASLFRHPFANWFLSTFFCIKVERPQDVGRPIDNARAFQKSRLHLESGGALYMAPEGTCFWEYKLRPLKTGVARIALDSLQAGACREITFLLAGIHYESPAHFRSRSVLRFSTFVLKREALHGDITDWQHVSDLTARLQEGMEQLLPHAGGEADTALRAKMSLLVPEISETPDWMALLYRYREATHLKGSEQANKLAALREVMSRKKLPKLNTRWLSGHRPHWWQMPVYGLAGLVLLHHIVIYGLPELVRVFLRADSVYDSTIRYLGGIVGYLVGAPMLLFIGMAALGTGWMVWCWWIAVLALGPWAWQKAVSFRHSWYWLQYKWGSRDRGWKKAMEDATLFLREEAP
jgi:hypothetical protein